MKNKIVKTLSITEEANKVWGEVAKRDNLSKSQLLENLIFDYANKCKADEYVLQSQDDSALVIMINGFILVSGVAIKIANNLAIMEVLKDYIVKNVSSNKQGYVITIEKRY